MSTVDLEIEGMTCAACAARIERTLNKVDGVTASVNYALETARVELPDGMAVARAIELVEGAGYGARLPEPGTPTDAPGPDPVARRALVVGLLAVPVVLVGMVPSWQFDGWTWWSLALTAPIATWGAWPFHRTAVANLRHGTATMDTLVSIGVAVAFAWSLGAVLLGGAGEPGMRHSFSWTADRAHGDQAVYFEVAAATTAFLLAGRSFERRARRRGGEAIRALAALGATDVARLAADGTEARVPVAALAVGDRFVVRPGEQVATDGVVEEGTSAVDAALLTGESVPVEVGPGDPVTGATVNAGGRLVVRATRVGADTTLAHLARLVSDAQSGKAPVQRLADRVAGVFVPVVVALAVGTFGFWLGRGDALVDAATPALAVLIVACPCALGLATPTALLAGTGRGAQLGVLIRGPEVLEASHSLDVVVLDKTGTITEGRMAVVEVVAAAGVDPDVALRRLAGLEAASEHPIGRAIAAAVPPEERPAVVDAVATPGLGLAGAVDGVTVTAGRPTHLEATGHPLPSDLAAAVGRAEAAGRTVVVAGWEGAARVAVALADRVRPSSAAAVAALRALGLEPVLLTGDQAAVAEAVAAEVGIDRVVAGVLPADKVAEVRRLQAEGRKVALVGDGVNDAAALAQADLGLAMGGGTDAARAAADLTLVRGDLLAAVDAVRLSRRTLRTIRANLGWAFGYNVAALPLAAAGLLNPMLAGLAMAASSVLVVANSLRLFRFRP